MQNFPSSLLPLVIVSLDHVQIGNMLPLCSYASDLFMIHMNCNTYLRSQLREKFVKDGCLEIINGQQIIV